MRFYRQLTVLSLLMLSISADAAKFENDRIEVYISTHADLSTGDFVLETEIVRFIAEAKHTLDIAVQELRYGGLGPDTKPIKDAILAAAKRGVKVRLMLEKSYLKEGTDNLQTFNEFQAEENIEVKQDGNSKIFHNKFVVRDKGKETAALLTGSTNFTDTGTRRNYNHIIVIHFTGTPKVYFEIVDRYQNEFNEFWAGTFKNEEPTQKIKPYRIGDTRITPLFAPDNDPDDHLLEQIVSAEESLDVMMFTFGSNSPLLTGVLNRANAVKYIDRKPTKLPKVKVRVAMESEQARYWSAYPVLKNLGIPVRLERNKSKLHHKVGIIDGKKVILGSYNWTLAANCDNDENALVVSNPAIAKLFTDAFEEIWDKVVEQPRGTLKIGSWNIEHLGSTKTNQPAPAVAEHILLTGTDIIALQEIYDTDNDPAKRTNAKLDTAMYILGQKAGHDWTYRILPNKDPNDVSQLCAVAWNKKKVQLVGEPLALETGGERQGYNLWDRRPHALKFTCGPGLSDVVIIPIHCKSNVGGDQTKHQRRMEAQVLMKQMDKVRAHFKDRDVILLGDANTVDSQEPMVRIIDRFGFRNLHTTSVGTEYWEKHNSFAPFDRIFVPRNQPEFKYSQQYILHPADYKLHDKKLSDHFAIVMAVSIGKDDD